MNTPWLRLYTEILNDPKLARLTDEQFRTYIRLLCAVKTYDRRGQLPPDEDTSFMLRLSLAAWRKSRDALIRIGLIDITETPQGKALSIHGWNRRQYESDHSHERVARYRKRQKAVTCNAQSPLHVTPPDTETDTDTDISPPTPSRKREGSETDTAPPRTSNGPDLTRYAAAIHARHPRHRRPALQAVERALAAVCMESTDPLRTAQTIDNHHAGWCSSEEWTGDGGRYAPSLLKWLDPRGCRWMQEPPESEPADWQPPEEDRFDEKGMWIPPERGVQ